MKRCRSIVGSLLLGVGLVQAGAVVGQAAPVFAARDVIGRLHRLSDYKGRILVMESFNPTCPFCTQDFGQGAAQELQAELTGLGAAWLVLHSETTDPSDANDSTTVARMSNGWLERGMRATAELTDPDGIVGRAFGLETTRHAVVIDERGIVAYSGAIDNRPDGHGDPRTARNFVREAVTNLLAGRPVEISETEPYGTMVGNSI